MAGAIIPADRVIVGVGLIAKGNTRVPPAHRRGRNIFQFIRLVAAVWIVRLEKVGRSALGRIVRAVTIPSASMITKAKRASPVADTGEKEAER